MNYDHVGGEKDRASCAEGGICPPEPCPKCFVPRGTPGSAFRPGVGCPSGNSLRGTPGSAFRPGVGCPSGNSFRGTPGSAFRPGVGCPSGYSLRGTPGSAFRPGVGCPSGYSLRGTPGSAVRPGVGRPAGHSLRGTPGSAIRPGVGRPAAGRRCRAPVVDDPADSAAMVSTGEAPRRPKPANFRGARSCRAPVRRVHLALARRSLARSKSPWTPLGKDWCRRGDLNPHVVAHTRP